MKALAMKRPRFFYGWYIVFACLTVGIADAAVANPVLSLFMKPMGTEFGWTRTTFSAVIFIASTGGSLLSMTVGPLIDKRGPRLVLAGGSAIIGGCLAALSRVSDIWHFYGIFGVARAVMGGATSLAIPVTVANWFIVKRGRAIGVAATGSLLGATLLPLLAQWLIDLGGWRFAWIGLGIIIFAVSVLPSAIFVRRRPEDMGLLPDGKAKKPANAEPGAAQPKKTTPEPTWGRSATLATSAFWLLTFAEAQGALTNGAVNMHQFPYLTDVGIDPAVAVGTVSVSALFAIAGSFFWGLVAERISVRYCLTIVFLVKGLSILVLLYTNNVAMAYLFAALWGLGRGGLVPLLAMIWAEYFGRKTLGSVRGLSLPIHLVANAFGPIIAGVVFDTTGNYVNAFIIFILLSATGSLWVFLSRKPRQRTQTA